MDVKTKRPATYADIEALPVGWVGEIIDDGLFATPRPAFGLAHVTSVLGVELGGPFGRGRNGPGGWWIIFEPELHLGRDILVPDLAGWRRDRMVKPPAPSEPFVTLAPDWVCEVLSPATATHDRARKLRVYARESVAHAWLIDPLERSLEVFRHTPEGWLLRGVFSRDEVCRPEPFDALPLELGALWLPTEPAAPL